MRVCVGVVVFSVHYLCEPSRVRILERRLFSPPFPPLSSQLMRVDIHVTLHKKKRKQKNRTNTQLRHTWRIYVNCL